MHRMRSLDLCCGCLREAQVVHLSCLDELGHRADRLLDRNVFVDPVLVVEIDRVDTASMTLPNLVASCTSVRRARTTFPTSSSLCPHPYMSAVSRKLTPRSSERLIVATDS